MNKIGIIVGSVPLGMELNLLNDIIDKEQRKNIYIVAADGGIDNLLAADIIPDEWVGDMDSAKVTTELDGVRITKVSPIKDETDMELALSKVVDNMCKLVYIFGGTGGGRIEHTFANIQLMHGYALKGIRVHMISEKCTMFVLAAGEGVLTGENRTDRVVSLGNYKSGYVSIFSLTDISYGVSIEGLFYEYKGDLRNTNALGISNEFKGEEARVSLESGALLIVTENINCLF